LIRWFRVARKLPAWRCLRWRICGAVESAQWGIWICSRN